MAQDAKHVVILEQVAKVMCSMIEKGMLRLDQVQETIKQTSDSFDQAYDKMYGR